MTDAVEDAAARVANVQGHRKMVADLYRLYYAEGLSDGDSVSSHWRDFGAKSEVGTDADGFPASFRGYGFGDVQGRWPLVVLGAVAAAGWALTGPDRAAFRDLLGPTRRLVKIMGLRFTQDAVRSLNAAVFLQRHLGTNPVKRVLAIGDGYGILSSFIKLIYPEAQVVLVDLGRTLIFQAIHVQRAYPEARHVLFNPDDPTASADAEPDFLYCTASDYEHLSGTFDLATNLASMQEMSTDVVAHYFAFIRRRVKLFYCCNREHKVLTGGEVSEFAKYPWSATDVHLVDELCPWHQWYLGIPWSGKGPRWHGVPIPLANYYDGPCRHRLTRTASS
jgi:putative sugar O-methyltransferase